MITRRDTTLWDRFIRRFKNHWIGVVIMAILASIVAITQFADFFDRTILKSQGRPRLKISSLNTPGRLSVLDGHPLRRNGDKDVHSGGFKARFSLSHSGKSKHTIKLTGVRLVVDEYKTGENARLAYQPDFDEIIGKGTAKAKTFQASLNGNLPVKPRWINECGMGQAAKSDNFLDIEPPHVLTFAPEADPGEELEVQVKASKLGFYKVRFKFEYYVDGKDYSVYSEPVYVYYQE